MNYWLWHGSSLKMQETCLWNLTSSWRWKLSTKIIWQWGTVESLKKLSGWKLIWKSLILSILIVRFFDREGSGYITFSQLTEILFNMGYSPLQTENIDDIVRKCSKDGENVDYGKLARVLTDNNIEPRDDIIWFLSLLPNSIILQSKRCL